MKKFKLIKEYPGSPKLGTIKPKDTIISGITFFDREKTPERDWIENYPEFWEEIVEKKI